MPETDMGLLRRAGTVLLWILTILMALGMGAAGVTKFLGDGWIRLFEGWGYPGWFALVIGTLEVAGAVLLLVPRFAAYAASLLIFIMVGAVWTVTTNETQLGVGTPLLNLVALAIIARIRWRERRYSDPRTLEGTPSDAI